MIKQFLESLINKTDTEPLISVDIGTSAIKLMSLDVSEEEPRLLSLASGSTPAEAITNNTVSKPMEVGTVIRAILDSNEIKGNKAAVAIPGPAVFTKKIKLPQTTIKELESTIEFEATNYIPHSANAVYMDHQVIGVDANGNMEVLLVAAKNEIVDSYLQAVREADLEPVIADVDYFALENMFNLNYPDERDRVVGLVNIGARYTSIGIMADGTSLFTGDVGVGGRLYTDTLCETLGMEPLQAERAKMGQDVDGFESELVREAIDRTTEHMISEIHRQLGFFWNASGTDRGIEAVYVCGGSAAAPNLVEELSEKTGLVCQHAEPFRAVESSENFDEKYLAEVGTSMGISVGLASRRTGDKKHAL